MLNRVGVFYDALRAQLPLPILRITQKMLKDHTVTITADVGYGTRRRPGDSPGGPLEMGKPTFKDRRHTCNIRSK